MMKKVSIIIPCKRIDEKTEKSIKECLKLDYDNFEIIVLPDHKAINKWGEKVKVISMKGKPAVKRNLGMKKSKADFYAFIDSDAYPRKDWLKNALKYFEDEKIGIVGGPNLTPPNSSFWERVSGHVLENFFATLFANIRYKIARNRFVKELPSCNYISRKEASEDYDPSYLTAEDSKFCFDCLKKGYKILYAGEVIVYHHRRDTLKGHLKQVFIYARDIARLTKEDFSFDKLYYSLNSIGLLVFIFCLVLSIFFYNVRLVLLYIVLFYLLVMVLVSIRKSLKITLANFIMLIGTHFSYGAGWIYGLISGRKVYNIS